MITVQQLAKIAPLSGKNADKYAEPLNISMKRFGILEPEHAAAFLAQVAHESGQFNRVVENLNYRADRLLAIFPKYFKSQQEAERFGRKPEAIANRVYANRIGNGNEASGDGWRYRGRGLIQVTGRANYTACGAGLGLNLVDHPELLELPEHAAASAAWFWWKHNLNARANDGDVRDETKIINGGTHGLAERQRFYRVALSVLNNAIA